MPRVIWQGRVSFTSPSEPGFVGRVVDGGNGTMAMEISRADAMGRARWDECPDAHVVRVLLAAVRDLSQTKTPELNVGCVLNLADGRLSDPITARGVPYQWPADPYADGAEPMRADIERVIERLASLSDAAGTDAAALRLRAMLRQPSKPLPAMPLPETAQ